MSVLSAGVQTALTTTANLAINSFEIRDGWLSFDGGSFTSGMASMTTWASTAAAAAGALTGGALGQANLKDGNKIVLNGHTFDTEAIQKLNNFTGSLVGAGVTYAMTGEATLNVLNLKDFTGNDKQGLGLLELHLGGDKGISMNLGTGGTDVSYGTVAGAMAGVADSGKIIGERLGALAEEISQKIAMKWAVINDPNSPEYNKILNGVVNTANGIISMEPFSPLPDWVPPKVANKIEPVLDTANELLTQAKEAEEAYKTAVNSLEGGLFPKEGETHENPIINYPITDTIPGALTGFGLGTEKILGIDGHGLFGGSYTNGPFGITWDSLIEGAGVNVSYSALLPGSNIGATLYAKLNTPWNEFPNYGFETGMSFDIISSPGSAVNIFWNFIKPLPGAGFPDNQPRVRAGVFYQREL